MTGSQLSESPPGRAVRYRPGAARWVLAALIAGPATIVLHELGHYIAGRLAGRTDLILHYASVGRLADVHDHAAVLTGGGLLVSWGLALACALRAWWRPAPLVVAAGVGAALKSAPCPFWVLAALAGNDGSDSQLDEVLLSRELGLPVLAGATVGSLVLLGCCAWLLWRVGSEERRRATIGLAVGFALGIPGWLVILGPWLLP